MNNNYGAAKQEYDDEERFLKDVILQIRQGKKRIYVYNKNIIQEIQKLFKNVEVIKSDFYWVIINNEVKAQAIKGRPRKVKI